VEYYTLLMLFQEYDFKIFLKHKNSHEGLDHLIRIENGVEEKKMEGYFPNANLFLGHIT
jgi:hypothetical protein